MSLMCGYPAKPRGARSGAGEVGTVVESLADDQVEFSGDDGRAYATAALPARDLIVLHYAPVMA